MIIWLVLFILLTITFASIALYRIDYIDSFLWAVLTFISGVTAIVFAVLAVIVFLIDYSVAKF